MLKVEEIHKHPALKSLVDQHDTGAVITNHFHLAPVLAEEHKQISVHQLRTHFFAHKIRQPIKTGAQINHRFEHEHADVGFKF